MSATIREEEIRIPTYHIREDPNPPLFGTNDPWVYPYPKQDEILRPIDHAQTYQAITLENPYLEVSVLPQLGGRLYRAYDKAGEREIFHKPPVIKPSLIGLRGAWICGGIEFNFVKGHHVLTCDRVDRRISENPDGSVSSTVGAMVRRSRGRWAVTLTLHPDRSYIQVDLRLYNRSRYRLDFYQWSNSSVVAQDDLVCPYPTDYVISSGRTLYRYPIQGGVDISRWENTPIAHDFFSIGSEKDFFGVYYEDSDLGMVHYADHHQAPGKKLFTWGTHDAGRIWDYLLADGDTPYIEPQSGAVVDQRTFLFLEPHQTVHWREYWWGIRGMKGFVEVNDEGALNLAPVDESRTLLAANTTRAVQGARIHLIVNGQIVYDEAFDISPNAPYSREIELAPASWRDADAQLVLANADDVELVRYHKPLPDMFAKVELPKPFEPNVDATSSAEALCVAANEAEKLRDYARAESLYHQALDVDPGYARALAHLGALHSAQGLYRVAHGELIMAVARDPDLAVAHYHLGIVWRELGNLPEARKHLWLTRLDPAFNAQSFHYLAEMALAQGRWDEAEGFFDRSTDLNWRHIKAHCLRAMGLRKMGRDDEARGILDTVRDHLDPMDVLALAEAYFLEPGDAAKRDLLERVEDDVELLIEVACDYAGSGQCEEARAVLKLWPGVADEAAAPAMLYYHLAYCEDKLGNVDDAQRTYALASQQARDGAFPHRLEELNILQRAVEVELEDARAWAYLGTWLYALRRKNEAMEAWLRSLSIEPDAVTHRNVGKALWMDDGALAGARAEYESAITLRSDDYHLYADLNDVMVEMGASAEERIALLESAPPHGRVQARLAAAMVEAEFWDEAIDLLAGMQFDPYEGERGTRPTYYAAYLGRGLDRLKWGDWEAALADFRATLEYPRNVGVGKSHFCQDSKALYCAGLAAEKLSQDGAARGYWEEGASIRTNVRADLDSPLEGYEPEALKYKVLCMQKLGRADEAASLF